MKNQQEVFITNSFEETQKLGESFIRDPTPKKARVMALYGDLGSGKTTFVQGLAKGLGITRRIISPTFIIIRKYRIINQESRQRRGSPRAVRIKNFYHIDLYRIQRDEDLKELGLREIIDDPKNVVAIEWAEKMRNRLPQDRVDIKFEYVGDNKRRITINNF